MTSHETDVIRAMSTYGGGFVKALAEAFTRADMKNFAILKKAFPDYWAEYEKWVSKRDTDRGARA